MILRIAYKFIGYVLCVFYGWIGLSHQLRDISASTVKVSAKLKSFALSPKQLFGFVVQLSWRDNIHFPPASIAFTPFSSRLEQFCWFAICFNAHLVSSGKNER